MNLPSQEALDLEEVLSRNVEDDNATPVGWKSLFMTDGVVVLAIVLWLLLF